MITDTNNEQVARLPLWKGVCEELENKGATDGMEIPLSWFAEKFHRNINDSWLRNDISAVREYFMRKHGLFLDCDGVGSDRYVFIHPRHNADVVVQKARLHFRHLRGLVEFAGKTDTSKLTNEERDRHTSIHERLANKLALMQRNQKQIA
jgi:hypothetical protein